MFARLATVAALMMMMPSSIARAGDGGGGSSSGSSSEGTSTESSSSGSEGSSSDSTSGTETSSTGTSDATSDTTGSTTRDDTRGDSSDTGCGSCPTGDESITFDTPQDGASVDAPFPVVVDIVPRCPCFDCSCAAEEFEYVQLFLDTVAWAGPCDTSPCEWTVTVSEVDEFLLTARAHYPSGDASTSIVVHVGSVAAGSTGFEDPTRPGDDGPEPTTSGAAGTTPASDDGCGCTPDPTAGRTPAALLLLPWCLLLAARTRRR